jgi:hypothetical protein
MLWSRLNPRTASNTPDYARYRAKIGKHIKIQRHAKCFDQTALQQDKGRNTCEKAGRVVQAPMIPIAKKPCNDEFK